MKKNLLIVIILILSTNVMGADVKVSQTDKEKYKFRIELANLILSRTANLFGESKIVPFSENDPTQKRCLLLLKQGKIDLAYLSPTEELLKDFSVIKIDIHNGMLGYRVFIINRKNQDKFSKVKNLNDLRKFKGGFGNQWSDYKVFGINKLPVTGVANTNNLLKMLNIGRFDYFHRGLHEAWAEVEANKNQLPNLIVEKSIALEYYYPVYFYFNKENVFLKKRFEKGFNIILKDGSFGKLFKKRFGHLADKAKLSKRTLIHIYYPVPKGLPGKDTSLWLD